ncbi:hypothetical protein, partial [Mesorhizobium japonicum]|uniref:hypothetical protein n=1 Tax=Mesorhizobium japonicum TaxID=2066070 RepID=UPI003B5CE497
VWSMPEKAVLSPTSRAIKLVNVSHNIRNSVDQANRNQHTELSASPASRKAEGAIQTEIVNACVRNARHSIQ